MEHLGAIWGLRILLSEPHAGSEADACLHDAVAAAIGLPELASPSPGRSGSAIRERLEGRLRELEATPVASTDHFLRNTATLARILGLTAVERDLLRLAIVLELVTGLAELFRNPAPVGVSEVCHLAATALVVPEKAVRAALDRQAALRTTGLVSFDSGAPYAVEFETMCGLVEHILSGRRTARSLMGLFVREAPTTKLSVADFSHAGEDVRAALRLVAGALRRRARGVNVLLHGPPGTGKSELVRAIAQALGARLYEVPDADDDDDAKPGRNRLSECAVAQRTLGRASRTLLVFDEVEDVFRVRWEGLVGLVREQGGNKSWTNRLLEASPLPTFWVSNEIRQIDPATLRRFDLIVELRTPPSNVRLTMLRNALGTTPVFSDGSPPIPA